MRIRDRCRFSDEPDDVARRATAEWWFWICNYPMVPVVAFVISARLGLAYLAFLSVHALVEASGARREAARSRSEAQSE